MHHIGWFITYVWTKLAEEKQQLKVIDDCCFTLSLNVLRTLTTWWIKAFHSYIITEQTLIFWPDTCSLFNYLFHFWLHKGLFPSQIQKLWFITRLRSNLLIKIWLFSTSGFPLLLFFLNSFLRLIFLLLLFSLHKCSLMTSVVFLLTSLFLCVYLLIFVSNYMNQFLFWAKHLFDNKNNGHFNKSMSSNAFILKQNNEGVGEH